MSNNLFVPVTATRSPRRWALASYAIHGKSTFAMKMRQPNLILDYDLRSADVVHHAKNPDQILRLPNEALLDVRETVSMLDKGVPQSGIKTITVDSITAFIKEYVNEAILESKEASVKNKQSAFIEKGVVMSLLQDAVCKFGTDVLLIWHKEDSKFNNEDVTKETLSAQEYKKLLRNLTAKLEIFDAGNGKLGMRVENLRPRPGFDVFAEFIDETGCWDGMPERIDAFLATGKAQPDTKAAPASASVPFRTKEEAIAFAVKEGYFPEATKAEEAYNKVRQNKAPKTASEMFSYYHEHLLSLHPKAA
mgnify:CR=1 FL=1